MKSWGYCACRGFDERLVDTVGDMRHPVDEPFRLDETEDAFARSGPAQSDVQLFMAKNVRVKVGAYSVERLTLALVNCHGVANS